MRPTARGRNIHRAVGELRDAKWLRRLEREKRNVAAFIPQWGPTACIPCGNGLAICSHAAIRMKG